MGSETTELTQLQNARLSKDVQEEKECKTWIPSIFSTF